MGRIRTAFDELSCRLLNPALSQSFAISSHLTNRERLELYTLAQASKLRSIVEIGSYLGASAAAFGAGLKVSGNDAARIYCIDTWKNNSMSEGGRDTMAEFLANTGAYSHWIVSLRGWSTELVSEVRRRTDRIDLLFIDGDHSMEGCLADWRAYAPHLEQGSIVAFHDIGWADGVQHTVNEHVRPRTRREVRLPNLWWGEIG